MTTDPRVKQRYLVKRAAGFSITQAAALVGVSRATATRWEGHRNAGMGQRRSRNAHVPELDQGLVIPHDKLKPEAKRALEDFSYFQERYLGRIATPWQAEAASRVEEWLVSPEKEFGVINAPPGSGKSTTFTHDIPAWLTAKNRAIRGLIGSRTGSQARTYARNLRRTLEAVVPIEAEDDLKARGLAVDAVACLGDDFGSFKPEHNDLWSADAFVVAQPGGRFIVKKEPTWTGFGMDQGVLGMRYDFIVWDDLVDSTALRTAEARENQRVWWDNVAERRLDPGGLLLLQGQRMGPDDLYRYALDKRVLLDEEDDDGFALEGGQMYHHVVFKAHYDDRCVKEHKRDAVPYPEGCLLDPRRVSWRELQSVRTNQSSSFAVVYQQEDVDPESVLVDPLWVSGGTDPKTGVHHPGCVDPDRKEWELPAGLFGDMLYVATADPSPTMYWSIQAWAIRCEEGVPHERYLLSHIRRKMDAPAFLDWTAATMSFTGIMQEWQQHATDLGMPFKYWIVEANSAQRFLLQYDHVKRWCAEWRCEVVPHQTTARKNDPEFGVQMLGPLYKFGLVRLPYRAHTDGKIGSLKLIDEVTHWPEWRTDDCVMSQYFLECNLMNLVPRGGSLPRFDRPSWLKHSDTWGWRDRWRELTRRGA